jgi:hypothetical protein
MSTCMTILQQSRVDWRVIALMLSPLAWLGLFYAFVVRARFHLGHRPVADWPDPHSLDFSLHALWICLGFLGVFLACAGAIAMALLQHSRGMRSFPWQVMVTSLAALLVLVAFCRADPGGYFAWFLD